MIKIGDLVYYNGKLGKIKEIKNEVVESISYLSGGGLSFCGGNKDNSDILFIDGEVVSLDYGDLLKVGDIFKLLDCTYSFNEIRNSYLMNYYEEKFNKRLVVKEIRENELIYNFVDSNKDRKYILEFKNKPILDVLTTKNYELTNEQITFLIESGFKLSGNRFEKPKPIE